MPILLFGTVFDLKQFFGKVLKLKCMKFTKIEKSENNHNKYKNFLSFLLIKFDKK